ncbi:carboxylating nicotinate-nucleotide diphosphorylase [Aquabacter spiritensis]|uniref:Probable nicotinate-nucleotide pyrophosphorylase [carboxylating] n=1 Tax=Aquabacter spiritensis TaxID=933073 RepID=A0A4R3M140_9HYPH|nr:carboxylating nicotinate-nucleotide diphosphorylase [Aquabacter spiritensis]TCT06814.1 nicotinate-nucleotide pyrophosphorylase [carboxylating] [Aquabacter spiritensis]
MTLSPLPALMTEPVVRAALLEDLGRAGDITTEAVIPADAVMEVAMVARQPGTLAGLGIAMQAFALMDPGLSLEPLAADGDAVRAGDAVLRIGGRARPILSAERVALNFACRLSGIASATAILAAAARAHGHARIACTRKTTPGLRALEKYAVRAGGGANHRFGLDDAVLIKDNHVAAAGGVAAAVRAARAYVGHLVKIELEVDTLAQLRAAMEIGVDAVLLDNMGPDMLREAVALVAGRAVTEASGRVTAETVPGIAAAGVDLISCGWLTHSAPILDLGLDFQG